MLTCSALTTCHRTRCFSPDDNDPTPTQPFCATETVIRSLVVRKPHWSIPATSPLAPTAPLTLTVTAMSDDLSSARTSADVLTHLRSLQSQQHNIADPLSLTTPDFAHFLDTSLNPAPHTRSLFTIPRCQPYTAESADCVYMCGNSLGLQPRLAAEYVKDEMDKWGRLGVEGHFNGARPWVSIDEPCLPLLADVVGAASTDEVGVMNTLSANLHLLLTSFYQPTKERYKVIMEEAAFCSDHHVIRSQLALHNIPVDGGLIQLKPRDGETYLQTADILAAIKDAGPALALVLLPGLQFYTGQLFDMRAITAAAHAVGAYCGFDLAHAVGNAVLELHEWQVDFAAWCTYKYLNSGPGAIAGLFFHSRHHSDGSLPKLAGWWGQTAQVRFQMKAEHQPIKGAQSYQLSNPAVLPTVCLYASLRTFEQAGGMRALRAKSVLLTSYLEQLLLQLLGPLSISLLTPTTLAERGCQLSVLLSLPVRGVLKRMEAAGVLCDGREPNVIRLAPTPLYNTFTDVWRTVNVLAAAVRDEMAHIDQPLKEQAGQGELEMKESEPAERAG